MQAILRGGNRVLVSTSTNVYTNLAFERYLAENVKHQPHTRLLLLWRNKPCAVMGRYQNPYVECDINYLTEKQIDLARRYSGGGECGHQCFFLYNDLYLFRTGTCYHDLGNLNMTVFTTRADYHRKTNLQWVVDTLNKAFQLTLYITDRDDIFLDTFKVTGSASRLNRLYAYHHFTLLLNANLSDLSRSLKSNDRNHITSKATLSVRSSVLNLSSRNSSLIYENALEVLTKSFFIWNKHDNSSHFDYIDPLSVIDHIRAYENELRSDTFLYDATPPFVYTIQTKNNHSIEMNVANGLITQIQNGTGIGEKELLGKSFHCVYNQIQALKKKIEMFG